MSRLRPNNSSKRLRRRLTPALGATVKLRLCSTLVAVSLCTMQVFSQEQTTQGLVTHGRALDLARQAAVKQHYDIEEYSLLSDGNDLSTDGKEWFFLYVCKKPGVDCGFAVTVNRTTAAVEVRSLP